MEEILLNGLCELSKTAFPRKCESCGRIYASFEEFIIETKQLKGRSGLMENLGCPEEGDDPIVELYRNCICGSTLLEFFQNRRDTSESGQRRRDIFEKLCRRLVELGLSREDARKELLQLLRFEKSPRLESMGIHLKFK